MDLTLNTNPQNPESAHEEGVNKGNGDQNAGGTGSGDQGQPKTFTQDQVNAIVATEKAKAMRQAAKQQPEITQQDVQKIVTEYLSGMFTPKSPEGEKNEAGAAISPELKQTLDEMKKTLETAKRERVNAAFTSIVSKKDISENMIDFVRDAVRLDLVEVDEQNNVNTKEIEEKIDKLIETVPGLKKQSGAFSFGANTGQMPAAKPGEYGKILGEKYTHKSEQSAQALDKLYG